MKKGASNECGAPFPSGVLGWSSRRCVLLCNERPLVKEIPNGVAIRILKCRSWNCDYCRKSRKRHVIKDAVAGDPNTLITITCRNDGSWGEEFAAKELVIAWRKFVRFAKKKYNYESIPYFAVFEATKAGFPHLHILCRVPWIPFDDLSLFMDLEIGSPSVDIRRCRHRTKAAKYVAKYLGKAPGKFGTCKRYWQTRDYSDPPPPEPKPKRAHFQWYSRADDTFWRTYLIYTEVKGYRPTVIDGDYYFIRPKGEP